MTETITPPKKQPKPPLQAAPLPLPTPKPKDAFELVNEFILGLEGRSDVKISGLRYNETPRPNEKLPDFGMREQEIVTIRLLVGRRK